MFPIPLKDNLKHLRFPFVTVLLIAINFAVFAWELGKSDSSNSNPQLERVGLSARDQAEISFGAIPYRITHPGKECAIGTTRSSSGGTQAQTVCEGTSDFAQAQALGAQGEPFVQLDAPPWWQTVFTSMFIHAGWIHILGNMLFLWIFGNSIEGAMGRLKFLLFYFAAGIAAVYSYALIKSGSGVPAVGASGAIAGILGAYILTFPRARILTFVFIFFFVTLVEVPALIALAIWFIFDALPGIGEAASSGGTDIAYLAHLGGFLFGLAVVRLLVSRKRVEAAAPPVWT